jgi:surfactin synthase thioesterase subunit
MSDSPIAKQAELLLRDLGRLRGGAEQGQKPLVFIGYSIGGIILKEVCHPFLLSEMPANNIFHNTRL